MNEEIIKQAEASIQALKQVAEKSKNFERRLATLQRAARGGSSESEASNALIACAIAEYEWGEAITEARRALQPFDIWR